MPRSYISLYYHLVFGTKYREPLIDESIESTLFAVIGSIIRKNDGKLIAAGGMPDHVHLLVSLSQKRAVMDVLRSVKAKSSRWMHLSAGVPEFRWQDGYGAFTVSRSGVDRVKRYIDHQKEHHRKEGYEEELIRFLERHGMPYVRRELFL